MFFRCGFLAVLWMLAGMPREGSSTEFSPIFLTANDFSVASGQPSLVTMASRSGTLPVWSLSGGSTGQSVVGLVPRLPEGCGGVKVEIVLISDDPGTSDQFEDVYRVHLSQLVDGKIFPTHAVQGTPVRTSVAAEPFYPRTVVLESYYAVNPAAPLSIRIQREPGDPADTFSRPMGLVLARIIPLEAPPASQTVQHEGGYNSWPMIQKLGDRLVCVYSRGGAHTIDEPTRATYARTSTDGGKSWTAETVVTNTPGYGDVPIGKGSDSTGAMLLWVRQVGKDWKHTLYRSEDGVTFTPLATPTFSVVPVQITDVFTVPNVGLMALWFAGKYDDEGPHHSWGTLVSTDDGVSWTQRVVESELTKAEWPTEPSAVWLGEGRILAVARTERNDSTTERAQFQMVSTDSGTTWSRSRTNIGDVQASTPSLIWDVETGLLSNYYYHRGRGVIRRRVVTPDTVFANPLCWPPSEAVGTGSAVLYDAGNVNAVPHSQVHILAFYSGQSPDTTVFVTSVQCPSTD